MKTANLDYIVNNIDSSDNIYYIDEEREKSYKKAFNYNPKDMIDVAFSLDEIAMASDCFILYAIDYLGCASTEMVMLFLKEMRRKGSELSIALGTNDKTLLINIKDRIRVLRNRGLIFRHWYKHKEAGGRDMGDVLFTVTAYAHEILMNRLRLSSGFLSQGSIAYKSITDLTNWAAAGYACCALMHSPCFEKVLDRASKFKSQMIFYPGELQMKSRNGDKMYVVFYDGNFLIDRTVQSQESYEEWVKGRMDEVFSYLKWRTQKGATLAVLTVSNMESLENTCNLLAANPNMRQCLGQIVFTSENVLRDALTYDRLNRAFCYMRLEGDSYVVEGLEDPSFV